MDVTAIIRKLSGPQRYGLLIGVVAVLIVIVVLVTASGGLASGWTAAKLKKVDQTCVGDNYANSVSGATSTKACVCLYAWASQNAPIQNDVMVNVSSGEAEAGARAEATCNKRYP